MTKKKFPELRADGTFGVDVVLDTSSTSVATVESWLKSWVSANTEWICTYPDYPQFEAERLQFSKTFSDSPVLVPSAVGTMAIHLEGKKDALYWRDWAAKLIGDLRTEFPLITLRCFLNANNSGL